MSKEYAPKGSKKNKEKVAGWVDDFTDDAAYNFESYADCFVSENLIQKYIKDGKVPLSNEVKESWRNNGKSGRA